MIYTVTLNPALDYTIQVDHMQLDHINRTKTERLFAGGKGINVSSVLKELDVDSLALGFIADFTGEQLNSMLNQQGIQTQFIKVSQGMTRINVKIKSNQETEINGMGPVIEQEHIDSLMKQLNQLQDNDYLILSGSIPSCMLENTYELIMEHLQHKGVNIVVDAEKKLMLNCLKYHPFLIKPNKKELEDVFQTKLTTQQDILFYAQKLQKMGARNVLVSMAKDGALLLDQNQHVTYMPTLRGEVVNSVGAGDSMVAGFIAGYLKSHDMLEALKLGTACGCASAFSPGLPNRSMIDYIYSQLTSQNLEDN